MKKKNLVRPVAMAMAVSLAFGSIPYNVMANEPTSRIEQPAANNMAPWQPMRGGVPADAISSATYYRKANWENKIKDKSRWKVEDSQTLVRVTTSDPIQMNDIDYDGMFIDANGRYVIRLVYKEKTQAASAVWHKALTNFGDLEKFVDFDLSHVVGRDGKTQYKLENVNGIVGRSFDLPSAVGGRANQRKNLPINLVLKEGIDLNSLGNKNFIVQMRITTDDYSKVYAYAPGKTSMDYSTYTKTTGVSLADKVNSLFLKGGLQADSNNATNQEFFMSEFIANPKDYSDASNLGIIRTQYMGQTNTVVRNTVGGEPIAFTQVFDANLVNYLKPDSKGNVGYVNVMTVARELSPYTKNVGIPKDKINYSADRKLAYIVIGTSDFSKGDVKVVQVPKHDQHTMLSGFYITAIDYVVDKGKFEDTFSSDKTRKLNYTMMSGWTNPNNKGWTVFEKKYANDYVVPEGESYLIDTTSKPAGDQIMIHIGGDQAISRKQQGYYNGFVTGKGAVDTITKFAEGVYKFTLREGATIKAGQSLKIYMPYDSTFAGPVNFLETDNGSKLNKGAATLTLQNDRNINMHIYTDLPRGASSKLKYTLKDETEQKELVFTTPKVGTFWQYKDNDKVLTGLPNTSILSTGGNFWINTKKLEPGKDIIVEAYDNKGNKIDSKTAWFKYVNIDKIKNTNKIAWTDHSDKSAILSINKSLYTPYQVLFTNDYADGTDDFYKDPRAFTGTNADFKKDTKEIVGYTKYDGGKVRTLYEENRVGKLYAKVQAAENEYDKDGNLVGGDVRKNVTIKKADIFDAQFNEEEKTYKAYEYKVDLTKMLPYHSDNKTETKLELKKDIKFVSTASDGSSLPSDLYETRVRARVLFDTTDGQFADNTKKAVKIVPDNVKFYGEEGYTANGFEGDNVEANTGDKFPEAPKSGTKTFLGWVTEAGKTALGATTVTTARFNALSKDQVFTSTSPVEKHLVVYAIYTNDKVVTFDANGGKFTDDKDEMTKQSSDLANVEAPKRDGYKFLGWAATKDAPKADADILKNVTDSKTVYAVWEKTAEELTLNAPTPVEVKDTKNLTSDEKDKVAEAVIAANSTLTKADITVADDGTVTVKTKDGKTGTLAPEKTVKQKEVTNEFKPPEKPVPVENKNALTDEEKTKVKQAVKDANPDRNFKDEDITVENDGTVTINQGGKVGTIPADKTVVQKDTILNLTPPEKTEVKDVTNLTQDERDKVAAAVKAKNNLADGDKIEVDSKGNVTVTTADGKTGTLKADQTVKPFDRAGKQLNDPAITTVADKNNLTEQEKQAVKDAVKAANKDLDFKYEEIQVADNGEVTVPMGTAGDQTIPADKTVRQATAADKIIKLNAPVKTPVADKTKLTKEEKDKVIAALKEANKDLPADVVITVSDDGAVTVTQGEGENQKVGQLSQADTVYEKIKAPKAPVEVKDPSNLTDEEKKAVEDAVKDANPNLPKDAKITVGNDGSVTVTDKDGNEIGKLKPEQTVKKDTTAPGAPTVKAKDNGDVTVTPPTDEDTKTVTVKYKDNNGNDKTVTATKDDDGKWSVPDGSDATVDPNTGVITVPADKVKDDTEVSAKATDKSGNTSTEEGKDTAKTPSGEADTTAPAAPKVEAKDDGSVTVTPPTDADTKEVEVIYTPEGSTTEKTIKVTKGDDGNWTTTDTDVTVDPSTGKITIPADKVADNTVVTAKAKDQTGNTSDPSTAIAKTPGEDTIKAPTKPVEVADPSHLTPEEKKAVEDAVKKANPNLPQDANIDVADDGTVTVTDANGNKIGTIPANKTVKPAINAPTTPVEVKDPSNLTPAEKEAVKKAVKDANPDLPADATIDVADDGTVTVKDANGKVIGKLSPDKTVKDINSGGQTPYPGNRDRDISGWFFYKDIEVKKEEQEVHERGYHEVYMYGYPDGTFRPNNNITRAEAAAMISRLKGYSLNDTSAPMFNDSKTGWFTSAINAVFKNGIMKGYKDGNFRPNAKITRAEFAQMIMNIDKPNSAVATFKDVKGHWAEAAINQAFGNGRINGYPDGTFRPDAPITRAEAVKIANSLMERSVDIVGLKEKLANPTMISRFSDLDSTHWAYYEIMEATNDHQFERRVNGLVDEDWLQIYKEK